MSSTSFQPSYETLSHSHSVIEKQAIASRSRTFAVLDGETVFLEGKHHPYMSLPAAYISGIWLTVVTNSPTIVCQLQRSSGVTGSSAPAAIFKKDTFYFSGEWADSVHSQRSAWTKRFWE